MRKEAVLNAIAHRDGYIPHNIELTQDLLRRFCARVGIETASFDAFANNHIRKCTLNRPDEALGGGLYRDEYGVIWDRSYDKDIGVIRNPLIGEPDIDLIDLPAVDRACVEEKTRAFVKGAGDAFVFAKINFSLFERMWSLCGLENAMVYLLTEPEFCEELLSRIMTRNLELIDIALSCGADGIYLGDDYGAQRGMLFGAKLFRRYFLGHLAAAFERAHAAGKIVCLHSCGNILDILGDLREAGLDVYQTVQPEIYDLRALKRQHGALCFFGAISTQRDLPTLAPDALGRVVRETAAILGAGGGYIAAPTHKVPGDVSIDTILALIDSFNALNTR